MAIPWHRRSLRLLPAWLPAAVAALCLASGAFAALGADELILIVNKNEPRGRELADYYAKVRGVPDGRVVELDLPDVDWLPRADWDDKIVAPVRAFLTEGGLRDQVRCAVTFYGVPLAVAAVASGEAEQADLREVDAAAAALAKTFVPLVRRAEFLAHDLGDQPPAWPREGMPGLEVALLHLQRAQQYLSNRLPTLTPDERQSAAARVAELQTAFDASFESGGERLTAPQINALLAADDPAGRRAARDALRVGGTLGQYAALLIQQQRRLDADQSDASFDSELATLWMNAPPRARWLPNPLAQPGRKAGDVLMVVRLDGRDPQQVRDLIDAGLAVEKDGLDGKVVVDARGLPATDAYGVFDAQLRDLADLLRRRGKLPVIFDDRAEVLSAPVEDAVAVYVGWYSLKNYVRGMRFVRGAVGYHVASFEMQSLRNNGQTGWVRGLLDDGVAATLGPVSEPYLSTFPPPERFVPLLLSGELALGEVYWRTTPVISWKVGLIGDPLYRPFAAKPALPRDALPPDAAALLD